MKSSLLELQQFLSLGWVNVIPLKIPTKDRHGGAGNSWASGSVQRTKMAPGPSSTSSFVSRSLESDAPKGLLRSAPCPEHPSGSGPSPECPHQPIPAVFKERSHPHSWQPQSHRFCSSLSLECSSPTHLGSPLPTQLLSTSAQTSLLYPHLSEQPGPLCTRDPTMAHELGPLPWAGLD